MVIGRRGIIRNPTSMNDAAVDTIWIVDAIDSTPQRNFILKRVPNRRIESMTAALEGKIVERSLFNTDGHPSYLQVAENLQGIS
ncbi:hypothetical protein ENBRE01_2099 [Enteropsectra breve]|nr:hypothetical protein ENBRE01_2099 [Enteropsectra breve]